VKIIAVTQDGIKPYEADEHLSTGRKFLFWKKENPVVKGGEDLLVILCSDGSHERLLLEVQFSDPNLLNRGRSVDGAGDMKDGKVTGWRSLGFAFTTPEPLRPQLCEALGAQEAPDVRW